MSSMRLQDIIQAHVRQRFVTRKELKTTSDQDWSWLPRHPKHVEFKSGVYAVFFRSSKREEWYVYVGQSQNIGHRLKFHCSINKRAYPNRKYRNIAKKYADSVRVRVLEICTPDEMPRVESEWLNRSAEHISVQMLLNTRMDNVETNRGLPATWMSDRWANDPVYRKKMLKVLRKGGKKSTENIAKDPERAALRVKNIQEVTKRREVKRHSSPYEMARMTMEASKSKVEGAFPVSVAGHCFGSYYHLAKAMRCSRRVATSGWKTGELYGFNIKRISWKAYLEFFKTAKNFRCKPLRSAMDESSAAKTLWKKNPLAGTTTPMFALSPEGVRLFFSTRLHCVEAVGCTPKNIADSLKYKTPFHGWKFKMLSKETAIKYLDRENPRVSLPAYTYGEKQMRTKRFLKELNVS